MHYLNEQCISSHTIVLRFFIIGRKSNKFLDLQTSFIKLDLDDGVNLVTYQPGIWPELGSELNRVRFDLIKLYQLYRSTHSLVNSAKTQLNFAFFEKNDNDVIITFLKKSSNDTILNQFELTYSSCDSSFRQDHEPSWV